ncbi:16S rRNA pseudouridine(516) synthase [Teredinibacter waterburyi]|jgi:pseudouridine synthase|uniref:16S rRNA pseudouridine(516) synthase n=1 Tax=Teredinibacter waterburyi TaxID=1500538 RepID=UPI00165F1D87|nr:pseudouridine synthase [Teredinibacter waterburyi]
MRIDKFLSDNTRFSRTDIRAIMHKGRVRRNQDVVLRGAEHMSPDADTIYLDDVAVVVQGAVYLMLHKPSGYVCATEDSDHPTVIDLLPEQLRDLKDPLQIVGRLDIDTTGLVLLTNDGKWNHRVSSPNTGCEKCYRVQTEQPIDPSSVDLFAAGIVLRGESKATLPAKLELVAPQEACIYLQEGKYHQVKRMFAATGNKVSRLHREAIGVVTLPADLAPGDYRVLTDNEVASLA